MNVMPRTMRPLRQQLVRLSVGLGLDASLAGGFAIPAFAADSISQVITAGSLTASVADVAVAIPQAYSHANQTPTGTMVLTANDSTGSGEGWGVTIESSDFVYGGSFGGTDIPAVNFVITTPGAPAMTAGQGVDGTDGPLAGVGGSLDEARQTVSASPEFGSGIYTQSLGVSLLVPAQSRAGTYTGTLTTSITAAP